VTVRIRKSQVGLGDSSGCSPAASDNLEPTPCVRACVRARACVCVWGGHAPVPPLELLNKLGFLKLGVTQFKGTLQYL